MNQPEKIAVLGGTGKAGRYLLKQLLEKGHAVKALARNPEKIEFSGPLIEVVKGDARAYESIHKLLSGCDAIISTMGPSRSEPDTTSIALGNILKVMQELGIQRYVEVAGLAIDAAGDSKGILTRIVAGIMKTMVPSIINDRQKSYRMLEESNVQWTLVRCPMISLTDSTGKIITSLADSPGLKVSSTSLAIFLENQISDKKFIRKAPFVATVRVNP